MRRKAKEPLPAKRRWQLRLAAIFLAVALLLVGIDVRLRPVIITMAEYQCRVVSLMAMNEAVSTALLQESELCQRLTTVEKGPGGDISAIEIDSAAVNELKTKLTMAVTNRLLSVGKQEIEIPIGTLLGWQLLAGRGPNVRLQVLPASFVQSEIVDTLETAGINQTQHRIFIRFQVEMSAILPGYSTSVTVDDEICVAQTLVVGQVPQVYATGK